MDVIFDLPITSRGEWNCGRQVRPLRIYQLNQQLLERSKIRYQTIVPDETKVGTALANRFSSLGIRIVGCNCNSVQHKLDGLPATWIANHKKEVVSLIIDNIRTPQKQVRIPLIKLVWTEIAVRVSEWFSGRHTKYILSICLWLAILDERRRLRNEKGVRNGMPL